MVFVGSTKAPHSLTPRLTHRRSAPPHRLRHRHRHGSMGHCLPGRDAASGQAATARTPCTTKLGDRCWSAPRDAARRAYRPNPHQPDGAHASLLPRNGHARVQQAHHVLKRESTAQGGKHIRSLVREHRIQSVYRARQPPVSACTAEQGGIKAMDSAGLALKVTW